MSPARLCLTLGLLALAGLLSLPAFAAPAWQQSQVTPAEMQMSHQWVQQNLLSAAGPAKAPSIDVLSSFAFAPNQKSMVAGQTYTRTLFTYAPTLLCVHLPAPGATLTAVTGVDTIGDTKGGKGNAIFSVQADGAVLYQSPGIHEGTANPVSVDLKGASDILLRVESGGDDNTFDRAVWADAKVTLADGREIWLGDAPVNPERRMPFSFSIGDRSVNTVLVSQPCQATDTVLDAQRTRHTLRWVDPATGLEIRCEATEYQDFPTVEWTLWLKNTGAQDTPPISNIQGLDCAIQPATASRYLLHNFEGSHASQLDYRPFATELAPNMVARYAAGGGRPSNGDQGGSMPYYNLDFGTNGAIMALGWPGQWTSSFTRDPAKGVLMQGGLQDAHFVLHPGEEVRGPLVALQFWQGGDWVRAQNIWRRWMRAHVVPRSNGELPAPFTSKVGSEGLYRTAAGELKDLTELQKDNMHFDYWWMDAGWYPPGPSWYDTGNWAVDATRYPHGIREVSDKAHGMSMKTILWFEPERTVIGSWMDVNHPQWVIGLPNRYERLLNLGNPEAWQWVVDMVDGTMQREGIDLYRQDFNTDPLPFWRHLDTPDRAGMTEMKYVMGYLALWDELHRRHPNLIIDSCSSGGRRNDLETLHRGIPLLRSDEQFHPEGQQNHTYGISFWMPFNGTGIGADSLYSLRSAYAPAYGTGGDVVLVRKTLGEIRPVQLAMLNGDYYPLTKYPDLNHVWVAWQFDLPEQGSGVVQAFRRTGCPDAAIMLKFRGLDPDATYQVRDVDKPTAATLTGRQLMVKGLRVELPPTSAAIFEYTRVNK